MTMRTAMNLFVVLVAAGLSACSGSSSGGAPPVIPQPSASASVQPAADVTFVLSIPAGAAPSAAHVHTADTSAATQSVAIAIGVKVLQTANVATGSKLCTNASGGGRSCSIGVDAPAGSDTFTITTYDQPNGTGNVLASATLVEAVSSTPSTVNVSVNAAIAKIALSLSNPSPPIGTAIPVTVVVSGVDADGNTVLGNFATPATLSDTDATGDTTLSGTTIASASSTVTLTYNGKYPFISASIAATMGSLSASATFAPLPSFLATYPEQAPPPPLSFIGPGYADIVLGPDGNMYTIGQSYAEFVKIAANGGLTTYPLASSSDDLMGLVVGADGNLWTAENQNSAIAKFNPSSGAITEYPLPTGSSGVALPDAVTLGNDGNVWFTDQINDVVGSITPSGTVTEYPLPANANPEKLTTGSDGNFWITDSNNNIIIKVSPAGTVLASYPVPTKNAGVYGIAAGSDGNLWFTESNGNKVGRITTGGTITEFATPTGNSDPLNIIAGPNGRMWFTEMGAEAGIGKIGYITTDGSQMREFVGDGEHVYDFAFDRSDTLWYVTSEPFGGTGEIGTFAY
jgi:streptogramin lyase